MIRRLIYNPDKIGEYMGKYKCSQREAWERIQDEYEEYADRKFQESRDERLIQRLTNEA